MTGDANLAERRDARRVSLVAEVGLETASHVYTGLTSDISRGGVFVATHHSVPLGSAVRLSIVLPQARLEVRGVVRWLRAPAEDAPAGLGVAFTELGAREHAILDAICKDREPYFYDFDEES